MDTVKVTAAYTFVEGNLGKGRKRRPSGNASRPQHTGGKQRHTSTKLSRLGAAQKWIIGAILAGLAASISAIIVNFTQNGLAPLAPSLTQRGGPSYPDNGLSETVDSTKGPILAVQITKGFSSKDCRSGGPGWVFPASAASVVSAAPGTGIKHGNKTWDQDPAAFGAIELGDMELSITATGPSSRAVVLDSIRFRVIRRQLALRGTLVTMDTGNGCNPGTAQVGYVNLDTSPPTLTPEEGPSPSISGLRVQPLKFPYIITESDPEILDLYVSTQRSDCTWVAELDWTAGSEVGHTVIEDNGHPFNMTALTGRSSVITWQHGATGWTRQRASN